MTTKDEAQTILALIGGEQARIRRDAGSSAEATAMLQAALFRLRVRPDAFSQAAYRRAGRMLKADLPKSPAPAGPPSLEPTTESGAEAVRRGRDYYRLPALILPPPSSPPLPPVRSPRYWDCMADCIVHAILGSAADPPPARTIPPCGVADLASGWMPVAQPAHRPVRRRRRKSRIVCVHPSLYCRVRDTAVPIAPVGLAVDPVASAAMRTARPDLYGTMPTLSEYAAMERRRREAEATERMREALYG